MADISLSDIAVGTGGFVINGECAHDRSGVGVASAGDVNGDGLDDLIIGARWADPDGTADADVSGREAYLRYGIVAFAAIQSVGGAILWATDAAETVIGCDHDDYDEVVAVWYPSRAAFLGLAAYPGYLEAHVHRDAAIDQATLIATRGEAAPALTPPFPT